MSEQILDPDASANALILVDFQEGFLRESSLHLRKLIQALVLDKRFGTIIATRFVNQPGTLWDTVIGWQGLMRPEEQVIAVALPEQAKIIDKTTYGLPETAWSALDPLLQSKRVFVAGLETDVCVSIIAAQLFDRGIPAYILAKYTASNRGSEHAGHAMTTLARIVGNSHIINAFL